MLDFHQIHADYRNLMNISEKLLHGPHSCAYPISDELIGAVMRQVGALPVKADCH